MTACYNVDVVAGLRRSGEKSAVHDKQPGAGRGSGRRHLRHQGDDDLSPSYVYCTQLRYVVTGEALPARDDHDFHQLVPSGED